jgi:hypothetical protein
MPKHRSGTATGVQQSPDAALIQQPLHEVEVNRRIRRGVAIIVRII